MVQLRRPVVAIEWGDAFIEGDDFTQEDADATEPVRRTSVGFLVASNQHGYVLATDTYHESDEIAGRMFIPHGMVLGVKKLTSCEDS